MHRGSIHQRHPKAPFKSKPCGFDCYTVLAPVSKCYPLLMGRLPTCYSPVRHSSFSGGASSGGKRSVRLACIRHAASVRPEPGSNSPKSFVLPEPRTPLGPKPRYSCFSIRITRSATGACAPASARLAFVQFSRNIQLLSKRPIYFIRNFIICQHWKNSKIVLTKKPSDRPFSNITHNISILAVCQCTFCYTNIKSAPLFRDAPFFGLCSLNLPASSFAERAVHRELTKNRLAA